MDKSSITIKDEHYSSWVKELKHRYLSLRLKASVAVNQTLLSFYWSIGKDIAERQYTNSYGAAFYKRLSLDMKRELPDAKGFSETNLKNMYYFYSLYNQYIAIHQQAADDFGLAELCSIPWDHQCRIVSNCKGDPEKAIYYVKKVIQHSWGRDMLVQFLKSDLYDREGKAITNFKNTLPEHQSDLAQQITKDPYNFDFLTIEENFKEKELENALLENVTKFLLELGTGFSYMGRQFRLKVGSQEFFPDLLFYNARIHAYCVLELKVTPFKPEYLGQLSFYVSAINKQFKTDLDNPTIGLLICQDKDNLVAQYALEPYNQPLGISEFQLSQLYPKDLKSTLPTIQELEEGLKSLTDTDK